MKNIRNLLESKGHQIYSVTPSTTVYDALILMMEKNISALLVMEGDQLEGIFTERDYARKLVLKGKTSKETLIGEIMTSQLLTITPDDTIESCMEIMTEKKIRHLPVLEHQAVTGMISIGDLVKFIIEDQKKTIEHLQSYISS